MQGSWCFATAERQGKQTKQTNKQGIKERKEEDDEEEDDDDDDDNDDDDEEEDTSTTTRLTSVDPHPPSPFAAPNSPSHPMALFLQPTLSPIAASKQSSGTQVSVSSRSTNVRACPPTLLLLYASEQEERRKRSLSETFGNTTHQERPAQQTF